MPGWVMDSLLIAHAGLACFMAGLVWFVQVVHYPLMREVGRDAFASYEREHVRRTGWVVAPAMLSEAMLAVVIALDGHAGTLGWVGVGLLGLIWVSTFGVQVPAHARLSQDFSDADWRWLVRTNWFRTALWSVRGVLALWMLAAR